MTRTADRVRSFIRETIVAWLTIAMLAVMIIPYALQVHADTYDRPHARTRHDTGQVTEIIKRTIPERTGRKV